VCHRPRTCISYVYLTLTFSSYVASLESRVDNLQRRIAYARARKASVAMHDRDEPTEPPDRKDSLATIRAAIHRKAARRREAADVNELVSDFGFLLVSLTKLGLAPLNIVQFSRCYNPRFRIKHD
jgi:hypothetical protein